MKVGPQIAHLAAVLTPHQQKFEFVRSKRWQQLPCADQQACRQLLAQLLCQVISQARQENDDEREDSVAAS